MKKKLSLLLAAAMMCSMLGACGQKTPDPETTQPETPPTSGTVTTPENSGTPETTPDLAEDNRPDVNLIVLSGPTGVGAAKLIADDEAGTTKNDYNVTVAAANDEVMAELVKPEGGANIAAVATNVAASLSAKTDGNIQVLAVNTLGVLYILEKGDTIHAISDLAGETLYATGQGANPEYALNHLLRENGVEPTDVDIQWLTPQEITAKMMSEESGICMLPVPAATGLMMQDSNVREAISLSDAWDDLGKGALAQGCVVVRKDFAEANPEVVADFMEEYKASIAYMNDEANLTDAAALVAKYAITANEKIAAKAIPQCNLTYVDGSEMRDMLEQYYQVLFDANPASIGNTMPYDSFYYGAN